METFTFTAQKREKLGKNDSKQLRQSGFVPAVVYGENSDPLHVTLNAREIGKFYRSHSRENVLIKLSVASSNGSTEEVTVLPKEYSKNAISLEVIHVDFLKIDPKHPLRTDVSLNFVGTAPGVKKGGNLMLKIRSLKIRALPDQIPHHVDIDLSSLEVGSSIRVKDIDTKDAYQILSAPEDIIAYVESLKGASEGSADAASAQAGAAKA